MCLKIFTLNYLFTERITWIFFKATIWTFKILIQAFILMWEHLLIRSSIWKLLTLTFRTGEPNIFKMSQFKSIYFIEVLRKTITNRIWTSCLNLIAVLTQQNFTFWALNRINDNLRARQARELLEIFLKCFNFIFRYIWV